MGATIQMVSKVNEVAKFKTRLAELLNEHGMSQADFVREATRRNYKITYQTTNQWFKDDLKSIRADTWMIVQDIFGVTMDEFFYVEGEDGDKVK